MLDDKKRELFFLISLIFLVIFLVLVRATLQYGLVVAEFRLIFKRSEQDGIA